MQCSRCAAVIKGSGLLLLSSYSNDDAREAATDWPTTDAARQWVPRAHPTGPVRFLFGWWHGFFFCVAYLNLPCLCFIVRCVGKAQGDNDGTGGSLHDALLVQEDTRLTNFSTRTLRTRTTRTSRCILLPFLILLCCFTAHAMQRGLWCKVASLACWCREWWATECLVLEPWSLSFHYVLVNGSEGVLLSCKLVMFLNVDIYIYTLAC
jgi:hypothetical protein